VVELLPPAVRVTEYRTLARRCPACGKRTRARLGRLLRRGQATPDRKAAALCRELTKWWAVRWTFARVPGVEPTKQRGRACLAAGGTVA
jgi:hypothetical protein